MQTPFVCAALRGKRRNGAGEGREGGERRGEGVAKHGSIDSSLPPTYNLAAAEKGAGKRKRKARRLL